MRLPAAIILSLCATAHAAEADYAAPWCAAAGGEPRTIVHPPGGRVDCVTAELACEADPSARWAEALGQALYYGAALRLRPCIVLEVSSALSCRHLVRLRMAAVPEVVIYQVGGWAGRCAE